MVRQSLSRRTVLAGLDASSAWLLGCKEGCGKKGGGGGGGGGDALKIGVILTLSGPQSSLGTEVEKGLMLALTMAGMQAGGRKIEILRNDDKNDPAVAVAAAKKLIETDKVDLIIGPSHSHVILALRPIVHDSKTILINPNAGAVQLAGQLCSPYIFATCRMNALYAESMGRYMAKKGIKAVAVTAANYAAGVDVVKGYKEAFVEEGNGKVVAELLPALNTTDFSPYLKQLVESKAEATFAFFTGELAINFVKQYDSQGLKAKLPLYTAGYTVEQDVLPAQGNSALGVFSTSVYSPFLDNDANKKFARAYKDKHGYPSEYSVLGYDAGQLALSAINTVNGKMDNKDALLRALKDARIDSPRGVFKLGPNQTPVQDAYLREVVAVDGQPVNKLLATAWSGYYYPGEGCNLAGIKK